MATRRKPYIHIARSILNEPWEPKVKLTCVLLQCLMADRWATDQLTADEASRIVLSPPDLMRATSAGTLRHARATLAALADKVSISVAYRNEYTLVEWPKFAEYQGWIAREEADARAAATRAAPQSAPSASPSPSPKREENPPPPQVTRFVDSEVKALPRPGWVVPNALYQTIAKLPGSEKYKRAFIEDNLGLMGLEVTKDDTLRTEATKAAALGSLTYRYYRSELKKIGLLPGETKDTKSEPRKSHFETDSERVDREFNESIARKEAGL